MTQNASVQTLLEQGHEQLDRGKYQAALEIFQLAAALEPQNPQVLYGLGLACSLQHRFWESIEYLTQALQIKPSYPLALTQRGIAYRTKNKVIKAKADLNQAIQITPHGYEDWQGRGRAFYELNQCEHALKSYKQAIELNPNHSRAWIFLGMTLAKLGNPEEALVSFNQALQLNPNAYNAWKYRGMTLAKLGNQEEALVSFNQALQLNPDSYKVWKSRGSTLKKLGNQEEATASLHKATELEYEFWYNCANILFDLGRDDEAYELYSKALKVRPNSYQALYKRGIILFNSGDEDEAIKNYETALEIRPDGYEAWYNLGILQNHLCLEEKAIASYKKALENRPDAYEIWYHLGMAQFDITRYDEAIASYDKAIEIYPDYYEAWYNLGILQNDLGLEEKAIASYKKALENRPDAYEIWYRLGSVLFDLTRYDEAIASYDKAIEIYPDYVEAWKSRSLALKILGRWEEAIASYKTARKIDPKNAKTWYEIGKLLDNLGNREEAFYNYDEAVNIDPDYEEAWYERSKVLQILKRYREALDSYETTLALNPNNCVAWNGKGLALTNLEVYPDGIAAYKQALLLRQLFWRAWNNLGWAFINSGQNYELALKTWKDGLEVLNEETTKGFYHEGCGVLHHSSGKVYYREGQKQLNRDNWRKAKKSYEKALKFLENNQKLRERYLEVLQDLYITYLGLGQIDKAEELQRIGSDVLRRLQNEFSHPAKKKQLAFKFVGFNQLTVDLYAQSNQLVKALETAEEGKNACLTWLLSGWREDFPTPSWDRIKQLVNSTTTVVYWHLSPAALTTFIIKHDASEPILITTPLATNPEELPTPVRRLQEFEDWVKDWNQQYAEYRKGKKQGGATTNSWREQLPEMIARLGKILDIPAILPQLNNISQLILIPHRDLHRFPLHALFPDTFTITYLPSAQLGIDPLGRETRIEGNLLSVEHPDSKGFDLLPHAEIESAAITQLFNNPTPKRIAGPEATKTVVKDALTTGYSIFHFTGHGIYDSQHPKQSAIALTGEEYLTLEEICNINLSGYQLVSLSACETAITGNQTITEEYVGLVSAFLYQRVHYVISTLWTVTDDASSLLMIYFYWQLKKGKSPAVALAKATKWLRNLTDRKLERLYRVIFAQLPPEDKPLRPFLRKKLKQYGKMNLSQKKQKRFEDPYYWAAFTITGGYN